MVATAVILKEHQLLGLQFLNNSIGRQLLLMGSAGTGKTTLVAEFCERYEGKVLITAPTHKAAQVLRGKTNIECRTIQSFLKLKRDVSTGKQRFKYDPNTEIQRIDLLIVDEASMIDSRLLSFINHASEAHDFRVIFVGDGKQLNPVGEKDSPIFNLDIPRFELTKIVRHDNDIIDLSRNLQWLSEKRNGKHFKWLSELSLDMLVEANGTDKAKFITWTNKVVSMINSSVRSAIYGNPDQFEIGETLLLSAPHGDYKNNQEVEVKTLKESSHFYNHHQVPYPRLKTMFINNSIIAVHHEDLVKYNQNVEHLKRLAISKQCSWRVYYEYKEAFLDYQYNHAVTVHKSQGSTYENSFVHITDIMRNPTYEERQRMLYTAITRASDTNYLI